MKKILSAILLFSLTFTGCNKDCETDPKNTTTNGCGDFMVYDNVVINGFDFSYVRINVDREKLDLNKQFKSFDLVNHPNISSKIETYNGVHEYCNDDISPVIKIIEIWEIQSGIIKLKIEREKNKCEYGYVVDVVLENAVYKNSLGDEFTIENKFLDNVFVGWYSG